MAGGFVGGISWVGKVGGLVGGATTWVGTTNVTVGGMGVVVDRLQAMPTNKTRPMRKTNGGKRRGFIKISMGKNKNNYLL
jgi:hypothetical protein